MTKKGRPADKDKYVGVVLNLLTRGSDRKDATDLISAGLNKMTCLELATIACKLGYRSENLPSRTQAQRDRINTITSVVNFEERRHDDSIIGPKENYNANDNSDG